VDDVAPAAYLACDVGVELARDRVDECARSVEQEPPAPLRPLAGEPGDDLPLGVRADAARLAEPPRLRGCAQVVRRMDPELLAERDHALRSETDEPSERDELRLDVALELLELGETSRRDELLQAALDARADAAQLADASGAHELCNRRARLAHELGRAAVRAHRVVTGTCEIEQAGVRIEGLRDLRVGHAASLFP